MKIYQFPLIRKNLSRFLIQQAVIECILLVVLLIHIFSGEAARRQTAMTVVLAVLPFAYLLNDIVQFLRVYRLLGYCTLSESAAVSYSALKKRWCEVQLSEKEVYRQSVQVVGEHGFSEEYAVLSNAALPTFDDTKTYLKRELLRLCNREMTIVLPLNEEVKAHLGNIESIKNQSRNQSEPDQSGDGFLIDKNSN